MTSMVYISCAEISEEEIAQHYAPEILAAVNSVESAKDHSTYLYVGNNGIHYYSGGVAEVPATYKGSYEKNPCSYELRPLTQLWELRMGPYGDGCVLASYGSFCGENYEKNAANTPWAWRNKTEYGLRGKKWRLLSKRKRRLRSKHADL